MWWVNNKKFGTLIIAVIFTHWCDQASLGVNGDVTCYVCSWSRADTLNGSNKVPDTCTPSHFVPAAARQVQCIGGCETMTYKDVQHGPIRHFHRNCVASSTSRVFQDKCDNIVGKTQFEEKCECFGSLCNSSPLGRSWSSYLISIVPWTITITSQVSFSSLMNPSVFESL